MPTFVSRITGSIGTKVALILLAMVATTAAAITASYLNTRAVSAHVNSLLGQNVPAIRDGMRVIVDFSNMREALTDFLLASDAAELTAQTAEFNGLIAETERGIRAMSPLVAAPLLPLVRAIKTELAKPVAARLEFFVQQEAIRSAITDLYSVSNRIGTTLSLQGDAALGKLKAAGEATTRSVGDTLDSLVNRDFAALRQMLELRAELNLLAGVSLALAATPDQALASILRDLGQAATNRLEIIMPNLVSVPGMSAHMDVLNSARTLFAGILDAGTMRAALRKSDVLAMRQATDVALSTAIDEVAFSLTIANEDASARNSTAIARLLAEEVSSIRDLIGLDIEVKRLVNQALEAALATDSADLGNLQRRLTDQSTRVAKRLDGRDGQIVTLVTRLLAITDPQTGIVAHQRALLNAQADMQRSTIAAEKQVGKHVEMAIALADAQIAQVIRAGDAINLQIADTQRLMSLILSVSAAIALAAPCLAFGLIVRPLRTLSRTTTALAAGDMDAVARLRQQGGEIGAMVRALGVFRDGLLDRSRLEAEERASIAARAAAERRAFEEDQAREARERQNRADQRQAQHDLQTAEAAQRDALRHAAEAERQARLATQTTVVAALADGLRQLADGDLRARIDQAFPDGYEPLRQDFNATVVALEEVIGSIRRSVASIHGGSGEISHAAGDLSRRTEQTTATLEESAAALTELTASVASAAVGADEAARIVDLARTSAARSGPVVREAVAAMGAIEDSSRRISAIIGLIDDISFQTNLLALNAGVEAARAGEAGRGFAVVATEVRALSQRSADAAREIGALISESGRQVNRGVALVDQAGTALQSIVQSVTDISVHVTGIAASAREQSTGISEINAAIGHLDQATQQNAAMVEQTTAASRNLAEEAAILAQTVARFSTGDDPRWASSDDGADAWRSAS